MQKRGQVTVFVVLGITVIILVGLIFFMRDYYGLGVEPKIFIQGPLDSIKQELTGCIDGIAVPTIKLIAEQGGSLDSAKYRFYNSRKVKYLCQDIPGEKACLNSMDSVKEIEENVEEKLKSELKSCVSEELLKSKRGYIISDAELQVDVKILQQTVLVEVDYPVTVSKDGVTLELGKVKRELPDTPLGYLYRTAHLIVDSYARLGSFYHLPYMLEQKGNIIIQVDKPYPDVIYILNKKDSEFKFVFAIEGVS